PRLVAEDAAARARTRRIDGENGDAQPLPDQEEPESLDERALAGAGHAGDPHPRRLPRVRQEELQQPLCGFLVVGPRALDERDRLRGRAPAPGRQLAGERLRRRGGSRPRRRGVVARSHRGASYRAAPACSTAPPYASRRMAVAVAPLSESRRARSTSSPTPCPS